MFPTNKIRISLRGSLAESASKIRESLGQEAVTDFMQDVLSSDDPDLSCNELDGLLIVGRISEQGKFLPDW